MHYDPTLMSNTSHTMYGKGITADVWEQKKQGGQSTWSLWRSPRELWARPAGIPGAARGTHSSPRAAPGAGIFSAETALPAGREPLSAVACSICGSNACNW